MRNRKFFIGIVTVLAIFIFGFILMRAVYYFPDDEEVQIPVAQVSEVTPGLPTAENSALVPESPSSTQLVSSLRLLIPSIDVDAKIEESGITKKGNMAAPKIFSEVGWYKYGTFPGETGSAVIAGHVNNGLSFPAVFSKLEDLKKGDDVYINKKEGARLHFVVTGSKVYDFDASPQEVKEVFSDDSGKLLKLITCTGAWISELRTHNQRLVVSAILSTD